MLGLLLTVAAGASPDTPVPLEAISYTVDVTGPVAEVVVRQTFRNRSREFVDATYLFPLDDDAVVDGMVMQIGDDTIRSVVLPRDEAREVWSEAAASGRVAALTEQQRPNVFTQDVSNLPPGVAIEVELRVVQPVDRVDGQWELVLPLVVAPRFVRPGDAAGQAVLASYVDPADAGGAAATEERRGVRADIDVVIHATAAVHAVGSPSHAPAIALDGPDASAGVDDVPLDRDFVLRWRTDGDAPQLGVLKAGNHAMLMIEAPKVVPRARRAPRELIWVVDTSCSMSGEKIELAKAAMLGALDTMDPRDSFAVLGFDDDVRSATRGPVPATPWNVERARRFVKSLRASGGTWMEQAVRVALGFPDDPDRRRMVVLVTDGEIGHDAELLAEIARTAGDATFVPLGIGSAPNRYLLDEMARLGGGVAAYADHPRDLATLVDAMDRPVLTDFRIDWGDCRATQVAPAALPPLRPGHPVHLLARIDGACTGPVVVEALGDCWMTFRLAAREVPRDRAIASTFARSRVADLERRGMRGELGDPGPEIEAIGIEYGIVTSRTSRVAVWDRVVNPTGSAAAVPVPLDLPAGEPYAAGEEIQVTGRIDAVKVVSRQSLSSMPAGRTYQTAVQSVAGVAARARGNPNMAGAATNEGAYYLPGGTDVVDPLTGTMSLNYGRLRPGFAHDPLAVARLPEVAGGPATLRTEVPIPDALHMAAEVHGAGFTGDATAGGGAGASVAGAVVPERVWIGIDARGTRATLDGASALTGRSAARVELAPARGHRLELGGSAAPGQLAVPGRDPLALGQWNADAGWIWAAGPGAVDLAGAWDRRAIGAGSRERATADAALRAALDHHRASVGASFARTRWGDAGGRAWNQDLLGLFAQDVWDLARGLKASGGIRLDALSAPSRVLASPRLTVRVDPGADGRTTLAVGYAVYRDPARVLPAALAEVRLPREGELLVAAEHRVGTVVLSLSGAWSRQRFAFAPDPALALLPAGPAPAVSRDVVRASAGLAAELGPSLDLTAAWHFRPQLGTADPALLSAPVAPFVPGFLDAHRTHAADLAVAWKGPWGLVVRSFGQWAGAVAGADRSTWWTRARLTAGGGLEHWLPMARGHLALTASMAVSSNDPAASVLPLEAYALGLPVPSLGDQPPVRGEVGLRFRY